MKREDIYIEVTPETVGAYVAVLEKHGEKIGDVQVYEIYKVLRYAPIRGFWFVGPSDYDEHGTAFWTPEQLDQWLTAQKPAESAEPSEPSEPAKTTTLLFTDAGTFEPVEVCKGWEVVLLANGERKCVPTGLLYSCALTPFQP